MSRDRARADDHLGAVFDDRPHQRFDVARVVLVVGVGVDDDVRAIGDRGFETGHERRRESAIDRMPHDAIDAEAFGDSRGVVRGAVVDDQPFDGVATGNLARKMRDRRRQRSRFVVTRNLDDQLHRVLIPKMSVDDSSAGGGRNIGGARAKRPRAEPMLSFHRQNARMAATPCAPRDRAVPMSATPSPPSA